jgi:nicotinate-nucleotide adenylyltransferase
MRVALFGGSFDPPHVAHQMAWLYVRVAGGLDRVLVVPTFRHAFDKRLSPFEDRLRMVELAAAPIRGVEVSDLERRLGGESRTLVTVRALLDEHPGADVRIVIGADLVEETARWYGAEELRRIARFMVIGRAGYAETGGGLATEPPRIELPNVSSTEIRRRIAAGESAAHLLPADVADHILSRGLYRAPAP